MNEPYHKIDSVYKRDSRGKFILGEWANEYIEYLANNQWEWTEKVDGTNIRVDWNADAKLVLFNGKTDEAQIPSNLVQKLIELFPIGVFDTLESMTLYGEGIGFNINKGKKYFQYDPNSNVDFVLFDVRVGEWWLRRDDVNDIARKLGVISVPCVGYGTLNEAIELVKCGFQSSWGNFIAEGLVMRPVARLCTMDGKRIVTKVKHKDFK